MKSTLSDISIFISAFFLSKFATAGDIRNAGSIPGEGHGNPFQYSCLENPMDREVWWTTADGAAKSWPRLKWLHTRTHTRHLSSTFSPALILFLVKYFIKMDHSRTLHLPSHWYSAVRKLLLHLLYFFGYPKLSITQPWFIHECEHKGFYWEVNALSLPSAFTDLFSFVGIFLWFISLLSFPLYYHFKCYEREQPIIPKQAPQSFCFSTLFLAKLS